MLALLSLLAFLGMVFYTFAAQERAAADYFSEAAKKVDYEADSVWPHMLEQVLVGPSLSQKGSILYSPSRRHSLVGNLFGSDVYPGNGRGIAVAYDAATGEPMTTNPAHSDLLNFVDSAAVHGLSTDRSVPEPDVDYTYPDINNLFLAYRGWAVRQDPSGGRTQVPVFIPSFFRPQYMRRSGSSLTGRLSAGFERTFGSATFPVSANPHWAYAYAPGRNNASALPAAPDIRNRDSVLFGGRSFRPHPSHLAGFGPGGVPVRRYLTDDEAAQSGISLTAGGFPFLPKEHGAGKGNGIAGDLGIWTGSPDLAYELDADNDGDGITEGIWLDLQYPIQEFEDSSGRTRTYAVLHSVTIYDLDGLLNLNVHGNLAGLPKTGRTSAGRAFHLTVPQVASNGDLSARFLSRSHHGLGPNEVNPIWGLRRTTPAAKPFSASLSNHAAAHFAHHFGMVPEDGLEQGNMEWLWLMTGRGEYAQHSVKRDPQTQQVTGAAVSGFDSVMSGRWGDEQLLYSSLAMTSPRLRVVDLPRPGRSGYSRAAASGPVSFGGRNGFDDNRDSHEGAGWEQTGTVLRRPYRHPLSFSGIGRRTRVNLPTYNAANGRFEYSLAGTLFPTSNPLVPILLQSPGSMDIDRYPAYLNYGASSVAVSGEKYFHGTDGQYTGTHKQLGGTTGDDLLVAPVWDELFEDPLETIFDQDQAIRVHDSLFPIGDTASLHWPSSHLARVQVSDAQDLISTRLSNLAPFGLGMDSDNREMFTTHSNSLRHFPMTRSAERRWEFSADTDNDGHPEFPPAFGTTASDGKPYSLTDPFRPPVRRLLTNEARDRSKLIGSLPLSLNHITDVDRTSGVPPEGTSAYLAHLMRSGIRMRPLTEHPYGTDSSPAARQVLNARRLLTLELGRDRDPNTVRQAAAVAFPPRTIAEQEFHARRDRQQLARDIYVLLYTIGGAQRSASGVRDYTQHNAPDDLPGQALYTHDQLRQMAQLAVNLVDSMDTDSVITKFEYDKNLGDGWNLDDDPFTAEERPLPSGTKGSTARETFERRTSGGLYPEDNLNRGVVYGVESQQLTFNEVFAVSCNTTNKINHRATPHDDTKQAREHLFVELKNVQPNSVSLATSRSTNAATGIYRLARFDRPDKEAPLRSPQHPDAAVTFLKNAGKLAGGTTYTIATASDDLVVNSDLFIDWNMDGIFELIAPDTPAIDLPNSKTRFTDAGTPELKPRTNLDLIHPDHQNGRFAVTNALQRTAPSPGAFLDQMEIYRGNERLLRLRGKSGVGGDFDGKWSDKGFDLVLQRRLNPNMPSVTKSSGQATEINPWVDVDRIRVEFTNFDIQDNDKPKDFTGRTGRLALLRSSERKEPLDDTSRQLFTLPRSLTDYRFHSIGADFNNARLKDPSEPHREVAGPRHNPLEGSDLWQPHFDRNFTSSAELLQLPVVGPNLLTQRLRHSQFSPNQQTLANAVDHAVSGAAAVFMQPDFDLTTEGDLHRDNRWYRLFQFVEVPSRVNRMLGNYLTQGRLPGKININMIRHQEVLAGLIDDPVFADTDNDRLTSPFLAARTPGSAYRDRWMEFLLERDGTAVDGYFDPTPANPGSGDESTRFLIPGTPGSRPFRSFGFTHENADENAIHHTLLRTLMHDRDEDSDGDDNELVVGSSADDDDRDLLPDDSVSGLAEKSNRHWLEPGAIVLHTNPIAATSTVERYQVLSKLLNNTTTVSNTFVMFSTAAYFEAWEDPASGLYRIGGRLDLEGTHGSNPGWQQRAVFILDRTEAIHAWDPRTQSFDWKRLVKYQAQIE